MPLIHRLLQSFARSRPVRLGVALLIPCVALCLVPACTTVMDPVFTDFRMVDTFTGPALAEGGMGVEVSSDVVEIEPEEARFISELLLKTMKKERPAYWVVPLGLEQDDSLPEVTDAEASSRNFRYLARLEILADNQTTTENYSNDIDDDCVREIERQYKEQRDRAFKLGVASMLPDESVRDREQCRREKYTNVFRRDMEIGITVHDLRDGSEVWHGKIFGSRVFEDGRAVEKGNFTAAILVGFTGGMMAPVRQELLGDLFRKFARNLP